jgi:hypothetical protein
MKVLCAVCSGEANVAGACWWMVAGVGMQRCEECLLCQYANAGTVGGLQLNGAGARCNGLSVVKKVHRYTDRESVSELVHSGARNGV